MAYRSVPTFGTAAVRCTPTLPCSLSILVPTSLSGSSPALGRAIDVGDGTYFTHVPKAVVLRLEPAS